MKRRNDAAGEIIPQALCKSYALVIGNYCAGMVRVLCYAVGIISWPVSKVLDYVLGKEHTVILLTVIWSQITRLLLGFPAACCRSPEQGWHFVSCMFACLPHIVHGHEVTAVSANIKLSCTVFLQS